VRRRLALVAVGAVALIGCGSSNTVSGRATVWVTRDRGTVMLHVAKVPAGLTAMQGLQRVAKTDTSYGGRYVSSVDGLGEHGRRAWFYYVNGYLADRGAADYRLRRGDVEWWDFRPWNNPAQDPVVVGSFPEPFLHGYDGKRLPAMVAALDPTNALVRAVARRLHARPVLATAKIPRNANALFVGGALTTGETRFEARLRHQGTPPGSPVRMLFLGDMRRLARLRWPFRFRYQVHS
jgi:Domain of unknown function (DUF4430)